MMIIPILRSKRPLFNYSIYMYLKLFLCPIPNMGFEVLFFLVLFGVSSALQYNVTEVYTYDFATATRFDIVECNEACEECLSLGLKQIY